MDAARLRPYAASSPPLASRRRDSGLAYAGCGRASGARQTSRKRTASPTAAAAPPPPAYARPEALRREASEVEDAEYCRSRAAALQTLQKAGAFFHTPRAREQLEVLARTNVDAEMRRLQEESSRL
eukprot:NODE_22621_length_701_cov_1.001742.p4 GENE.NODE_22621_length_701_cov_1.001742~~NODE_22621_length_701_cov_1.001742.p4  ORF type:complete len:126 (+),score=39.52 NODE_22621_length_701_cov_1.001742:34-411(+)